MKKILLFAVLLLAAIAALFITAIWYLEFYQSGNSSMSGMMGQMMGNNQGTGPALAMPQSVSTLLLFLIVLAILAVGGIIYYYLVPEMKTTLVSAIPQSETVSVPAIETTKPREEPIAKELTWPTLIRTSKPEERKVLEVLSAHGGKYLQKLIVKESGLSKLKTHRILSRFAERGIVRVERSGNTNEISLADWLQSGKNTS